MSTTEIIWIIWNSVLENAIHAISFSSLTRAVLCLHVSPSREELLEESTEEPLPCTKRGHYTLSPPDSSCCDQFSPTQDPKWSSRVKAIVHHPLPQTHSSPYTETQNHPRGLSLHPPWLLPSFLVTWALNFYSAIPAQSEQSLGFFNHAQLTSESGHYLCHYFHLDHIFTPPLQHSRDSHRYHLRGASWSA